jgi:hypothetical protein
VLPLVIVTSYPVAAEAAVQPPLADTVTGRPEVAVGLTAKIAPNVCGDVGCENVIDWFVFAGAVTFAVKLAGAKLNEPPVVLETSVSEIVALPAATGVTLTVTTSPQLVQVIDAGETMATLELLLLRDVTNVVAPVKLQPFLPSPFLGVTPSSVVPGDPPTVRFITSSVASILGSRSLETSSAKAAVANTSETVMTTDNARVNRFRSIG